MAAPGLELLTEMQNQFLMSEQGMAEDDYLAWVDDEAEVVAVQVEGLVMVLVLVVTEMMVDGDDGGDGVIKVGDEDC